MLPADDGCHGDDVIGVSRVSHTQEKTEEENRCERGHDCVRRRADRIAGTLLI